VPLLVRFPTTPRARISEAVFRGDPAAAAHEVMERAYAPLLACAGQASRLHGGPSGWRGAMAGFNARAIAFPSISTVLVPEAAAATL
jgi:hypothetical protein